MSKIVPAVPTLTHIRITSDGAGVGLVSKDRYVFWAKYIPRSLLSTGPPAVWKSVDCARKSPIDEEDRLVGKEKSVLNSSWEVCRVQVAVDESRRYPDGHAPTQIELENGGKNND